MLLQIFFTIIISTAIGVKPNKNNTQNFREVILFAYDEDDTSLKKQLEILNNDPKGLAERDIKFSVKIFAKDKTLAHQKFKITKNKFAFVLIGKDGGEKYRSLTVVTKKELFSIIDAMTMRVYEMRKQ